MGSAGYHVGAGLTFCFFCLQLLQAMRIRCLADAARDMELIFISHSFVVRFKISGCVEGFNRHFHEHGVGGDKPRARAPPINEEGADFRPQHMGTSYLRPT